jgi:hypothetical protein
MNQGVGAPAGFLDDTLFATTTTTRRTPPCSAAGKGSTRADAAAMAASRRGAHWRLPFMSLSSCRAAERDPVALVETCRRSLLWLLQSHRREPLRRCWIDHPYREEEITRLEDELLPAMESVLERTVDAVFRVGEAFLKRSGCNRSAVQGGPRGARSPGRVGAGGHVG